MATYVNMLTVIDRMRALYPNIGDIFFVDTDAGVNAAGRGTYALPLKTIQYAITNYAVANHDDLLVCYASAGGSFDENTTVVGVALSKATTHILGIDHPNVVNSNVGATSVMEISGAHCTVDGMFINPVGAYKGIYVTANWVRIGRQDAGNYFYGGSTQVDSVGIYCEMAYNVHWDAGGPGTYGYAIQGDYNLIHHNSLTTESAGTTGINFAATGEFNYAYENNVTGYSYGIQTGVGAIGNTCVRNAINSGIPIFDANAIGLNNWVGNAIIGVKTIGDFSYLVGVAEQTVFTSAASSFDGLLRHFVGSFDISAFTAARVITVRIYETIAGAGWQKIKEDPYTVGTDPNPHFDYYSFVTNRVTMQLSLTEAGATAVPRKIAVKVDE